MGPNPSSFMEAMEQLSLAKRLSHPTAQLLCPGPHPTLAKAALLTFGLSILLLFRVLIIVPSSCTLLVISVIVEEQQCIH
jgi:hypothetical protein